jgi:hypothetical protein
MLPAGDHDWWKTYKIHIGEGNLPGESGSYSELLASSVFCFALMGDGYSSRFDDAIIHGWVGGRWGQLAAQGAIKGWPGVAGGPRVEHAWPSPAELQR